MSHRHIAILASVALATVLFAYKCGGEEEAGVPGQRLLQDQLVQGKSFAVRPAEAKVAFETRWNRGGEWEIFKPVISVEHSELTLLADEAGDLTIPVFRLELADIPVRHDRLANPMVLRDVRVDLAPHTECDVADWSSDGKQCSAWFTGELTLSWSLDVGSGEAIPLGPQALSELSVEIVTKQTSDGMTAHLSTKLDDKLWSWVGVVSLYNLELDLTFDATER